MAQPDGPAIHTNGVCQEQVLCNFQQSDYFPSKIGSGALIFFWLCKYFESDLAKVIQSQTICQPAITTFPLGLYWKTYLYLFLSKKIAPKWKVIQVSKISLLSKVRDEGGGVFQNDKELFPIIVWILYLYGEKKNWKGSCTEDPARIPRVVDVYVAGSKASESLESNSKYESSEQIHLNWLNSQCQSKGKCFCSYKQRILDRFLLSAFVALG